MKKVSLHNLGCKVNAYETSVMQQELIKAGYEVVPFAQPADIIIINTCTVTNIADRKSRQMLHKAKKENPKALVVAVGCYVQTGQEEVLRDLSVDLAIGNNHKSELIAILEAALSQKEEAARGELISSKEAARGEIISSREIISSMEEMLDYEDMHLAQKDSKTRAYVKIQDGCNQFCSYCIIPYARGRVRSRSEIEVISEVQDLLVAGYQEIVITGIHLSSYGLDFAGDTRPSMVGSNSHLLDLLCKIDAMDGLQRLRLGSLEPRIITPSFVEGIRKLKHLCPHFHLSLQSGSASVLGRMNRHYTLEEYSSSLALLRSVFENPAITTDVIVGFPGETDNEFEDTKRYVQEQAFFEMHVFKYSKRKGTVAARMQGQVSGPVMNKRSEELLQLEVRQSQAYRSLFLGKQVKVLFEEQKEWKGKWYWVGHTPEYVRVAVSSEQKLDNIIREVLVDGLFEEDVLLGRLC